MGVRVKFRSALASVALSQCLLPAAVAPRCLIESLQPSLCPLAALSGAHQPCPMLTAPHSPSPHALRLPGIGYGQPMLAHAWHRHPSHQEKRCCTPDLQSCVHPPVWHNHLGCCSIHTVEPSTLHPCFPWVNRTHLSGTRDIHAPMAHGEPMA